MALTGQLSDMSLAELIEFFCNQRKTGRLKVDYHHGHGVFFIKDGELVDAKVGSLTGAEAVYFALTLPNAAFDFSGEVEPPRRTIEESWKHVVLEGLRRLDEGASPRQSDAFGPDWTPSEADLALLMDRIERLDAGGAEGGDEPQEAAARKEAGSARESGESREERESAAPMSLMVESAGASGAGGRKKLFVFGALACVVLACAVASVPVMRRMRANNQPAPAAAPAAAVQTDEPQAQAGDAPAAPEASTATDAAPAEEVIPQQGEPAAAAAALAARREREARERAARERRQEEARKNELADKSGETSTDASKPAAPVVSGPKVVRVSVSYDEQGRVTQASVAGATPGAEAYGATAVRIARGRRFPAGKPGGTVITIPVN